MLSDPLFSTIRCCCLMHCECFILGWFGIQQRTFTMVINPVFYTFTAVNIFARCYIMVMIHRGCKFFLAADLLLDKQVVGGYLHVLFQDHLPFLILCERLFPLLQ